MHQPTITCLNGQFIASSEAMLPVADRGFRFGDGVFETIRIISGVPYQWENHLSRLEASLSALRIAQPMVDWRAIARQVMAKNNAADGYLRIAISRGVGSHGYLPEAAITANWVIEYIPPTPPTTAPCKLWLSSITRPPPSALPVNHKIAHGIGSTLALLEARDNECNEALLLSANNHLSEASSGNLFWLVGEKIFTPALTTGCLAGTTRAAIMRLADVHEVEASSDALITADVAFISNVRHGIWPIASLMPQAKIFVANHPRLQILTAQLEADRVAYVTTHTKDWA